MLNITNRNSVTHHCPTAFDPEDNSGEEVVQTLAKLSEDVRFKLINVEASQNKDSTSSELLKEAEWYQEALRKYPSANEAHKVYTLEMQLAEVDLGKRQ